MIHFDPARIEGVHLNDQKRSSIPGFKPRGCASSAYHSSSERLLRCARAKRLSRRLHHDIAGHAS